MDLAGFFLRVKRLLVLEIYLLIVVCLHFNCVYFYICEKNVPNFNCVHKEFVIVSV